MPFTYEIPFIALTNSSRFNDKIFNTFSEAYSAYLKTILEGNNIAKDLPELEKAERSRIGNIFNLRFRLLVYFQMLLQAIQI
jgi:hypothetical protein